MEQEIDLRRYLQVLVRRWRLIRDVLIVAVASALLFSFLQPTVYEAKAAVASVRVRSQINFDPKFKTVSADELAAMGAGTVDLATRRTALAALVKNPLIAQEVIRDLGAQLPPDWQRPEVLVGAVEGGVAKGSDLIEIKVRGSDPALLASIANSWAVAYERQVNRTYATGGAGSAPALAKEVAAARVGYEKANDAFVKFAANNRVDQLTRQIDEKRKTLESLQKGKQDAIAAIISRTTEARSAAIGQHLSTAFSAATVPLTRQAEEKVQRLSNLYATKVRLEQLLQDARTLRGQASREGASAASNALALLLLKAQVASAGSLPANLQVQVGTPPAVEGTGAQVSDLAALTSTLETRLQELDSAIDQQSRELQSGGGIKPPPAGNTLTLNNPLVAAAQEQARQMLQMEGLENALDSADGSSPLAQTIERLNKEILELEGALARENATKQELTRARDLAWDTYSTLARKVEETAIAAQVPGSEVSFALPAVPPEQPLAAARRLQTLGLAVALGLLVGVFGALAWDYLAAEARTPAVPWTALPRWAWRRVGSNSPRPRRVEQRSSVTAAPDA